MQRKRFAGSKLGRLTVPVQLDTTSPCHSAEMEQSKELHVGSQVKSANQVLYLDVWLKVFGCLKLREVVTLRRVCRSWDEMIRNHILNPRKELLICLVHYHTNKFFRKEHINECYYVKNYRQLLPLLEHHKRLASLKVFNFLVGSWFQLLFFENLNAVSFIDCSFSVDINNLTDHLKNITKLDIVNSDLIDEHIRIIGQNIVRLAHLNVSFNSQLTGAHLDSLNSTIRSLNLAYCLRLNDYKLCYSLQELLTKGVHLECLNLKPLNSINNLPITAFFVITSFKHLRILKLNCIPDLTLIGNSSPETSELEKLTLFGRLEVANSRPPNQCDHFLKWIFPTPCPNIRHLSLIDFPDKHSTDEGIIQCLTSCQEVTHLKLNNLPFLTSKSTIFIAELKNLQYLKFINVNLDDKTVSNILKQCVNLRTLIIDFLDNGIAKPYNLTEAIIHECIHLCETHPERQLRVKIIKSLLPTHKLFSIPKNLTLEIVKSRFLIRKKAIYVDDPVQM